MPTGIPEKLLKIVDDIASMGNVPLTRLTVMKKWLEPPGRLAAFALWMAFHAISEKKKQTGEAANLFRESKALLKNLDAHFPVLSAEQRTVASALHGRMRDFQNDYTDTRWARVRNIKIWELLLVEKAIGILLNPYADPSDGYKLAADYCQHYDPQFGNGLNGPSAVKIRKIARWMEKVEAVGTTAA